VRTERGLVVELHPWSERLKPRLQRSQVVKIVSPRMVAPGGRVETRTRPWRAFTTTPRTGLRSESRTLGVPRACHR
jgi:hypothetical protein